MKIFILLFLFTLTGCSIPKDPNNSLENARSGNLIVGYVHHPPFSFIKNGKAVGSEINIINEFAISENLNVNYVYGTETTLIKELEKYKIHIIVGGFKKKTIWKKKAGVTTTYSNTDNCMLVPKGENALLYKLESYLLNYRNKNGN